VIQKPDAVGARLDPSERALIESAAAALGISLSELVRRAAVSYARGVVNAQPQESDA
jgi:uncharacterized protein (DUF1778 family)